MMKYFMGVCCAMLLGLSACGDIDGRFPPSEVKSEVKEAVDFSYTELEKFRNLLMVCILITIIECMCCQLI